MIRFLFSAGSAACEAALEAHIKADLAAGDKIILLVPEQKTVVAERHWLNTLSPAAQLSFEVSNFTRLANRTFRTVGGLCYRYASDGIRALLMWRTLQALAPTLSKYGEHAATDMHLTDRMLSAVMQLGAYCVSPDMLAEACERLNEGEPLKAKLADLSKIYAAYKGELALQFDDATEDIARAAKLIAAHKALYADTHIYIDAFTDFTGEELTLCRVLAERTKSLTVTSPLEGPDGEGIHLASAMATYHRLRAMAATLGLGVFIEKFPKEKPKTALDYLARHLFDLSAEPAPLSLQESAEISIRIAPTPFEEAELAAATVAGLVRGGCHYRDIAVIMRDSTTYQGIIDAALEKENIPFYLAEKTDITVRPLIKLVLLALRIKCYGWQKEDVVGYLKTGLCGASPDDVNLFEEYAEIWHLQGEHVYLSPFTMSADGYRDAPSARAGRILAGANRTREQMLPPLLTLFTALDEAETAADQCRHIYELLVTLGVSEAMKARAALHLAAGERREAEEATRLWGILVDTLEAVAATGGPRMEVKDLIGALTLVFARTDVGAIPTAADEVTVGSAATLRAAHVRYAIVLGLNEGVFPQSVKEAGLLSDAEKARLAELGITLSAPTATVASDELFFVLRALSLPTCHLYLSYHETAGDGKHAEPSIAIRRVRTLFPTLTPVHQSALPPQERIFSLSAALEHLRELDGDTKSALLLLLEQEKDYAARLAHLKTPMCDTEAAISETRADTLFGPHAFHPTGIERFVSCQFAYYCKNVLGLREEPRDTLDSAAVGTFIHYVLEKTFSTVSEKKSTAYALTDEEKAVIINESIADYRAYLTEIGGGISPRVEALLTRLSALAHIVASALLEELSDSDFKPTFFELDLKQTGGDSRLTMENGDVIPLTGKVDRVDCYRAADGTVYLRVADYKTGKKSFKRDDIAEGFGLQMPLYLYALCHGSHRVLTERLGLAAGTVCRPAGVTYISTDIGTDTTAVRIPPAEARKSAASRLAREGLLPAEEELLSAVSKSKNSAVLKRQARTSAAEFDTLFAELAQTVSRIARDMKSGTAAARPNKLCKASPCNYCAFAPVCRAAQKNKFKGD